MPMKESAEMDPVARAFPDDALSDAAHELIGQALGALVDEGATLEDARAVVRAGLDAIVETYED